MKKSDCYRRAFTEVIASVVLNGDTKDLLGDEIVETLNLLFHDFDRARSEEAQALASTYADEEGQV